jgi:DNA-binding XRE family transcriptional regulator
MTGRHTHTQQGERQNIESSAMNHEASDAAKELSNTTFCAMWAQLAPNLENHASPSVESLELVEDPDAEDTPADGNQIPGRGQANLLLRLAMAKRMIAARELNGYSQTEAALLIGWKTPTQLSLIEQGKRIPPHYVLLLISRAYGVSTDFLYALDDEAERDSRTAGKKA